MATRSPAATLTAVSWCSSGTSCSHSKLCAAVQRAPQHVCTWLMLESSGHSSTREDLEGSASVHKPLVGVF